MGWGFQFQSPGFVVFMAGVVLAFGLNLPPAEKQKVEQLRKKLSELEQQFSRNINEARAPIDFTAEELADLLADNRLSELAELCQTAGIKAVVGKPILSDEIAETIGRVLNPA